jgi:hypothetical protein
MGRKRKPLTIFKHDIVPLLQDIFEICSENKISVHFAAQIDQKIWTTSKYQADCSPIFPFLEELAIEAQHLPKPPPEEPPNFLLLVPFDGKIH